MATTGKRFLDRTHDRSTHKVLDARTKTLLSAVLSEPRGKALEAYLRVRSTKKS